MNYQIKLFTEINEELKKDWVNLEGNSRATSFNNLVWIQNYERTFKKNINFSQLRIFTVTLDGETICIFPFEIIKKFKINILQWAADSKSDYNSPIIKKNFSFDKKLFKELWKKILNYLPDIDLVYLTKQINFLESLDNPFINYFQSYKEGKIYQINLPNSWDDYKNKVLKKKFYFDLMRTKRLIKKFGKVEFIIAKNSKEKLFFLETLFEQKKKKLIKNNKNLLNKKDLDFYKNFENYDNKKYTTQASGIKLNGEFIAMHWGIVIGNFYYYLLPSMKEDSVKKFAPGKLLLSLLIRWSISKKLKFFDFGYGEEQYKRKWSNNCVNIYSYIQLNKLRGMFYYSIIKAKQIVKYFKVILDK